MLDRFNEFLLRLTGTTGDEVRRYHPAVGGRRLKIGSLIVIAGLCGGVLVTLAVARIDPDHPARWFYALIAGALYAWVIVAYDSLFVASASGTKPKSVGPRVVMTLVMTAFTAITIDALVFGDRLLAEIDRTKTMTTLGARQRHAEVHDLESKGRLFDSATSTLDGLEQELAGDPPTAEFEQAVANVEAAMEALRQERATGLPRIDGLQAQITQLRQQLAELPPDTEEGQRAGQMRRIGDARQQMRDLQARIQQRQRSLDMSANRADEIRRAWRADKLEQRQRSFTDAQAARAALSAARNATEDDVRKSAAVHEKAFRPTLVEETMAFWSLALREPKYLFLGMILWMIAGLIELLGILARLWLERDELDANRCEQANRAILEAGTREQIAREVASLKAMREARAKAEFDVFFDELRFKQEASQRVSQALVDGFVRLQNQREAITDPQARESLELQFACLQAALDRHIAGLLASRSGAAAPDPGASMTAGGSMASIVPPASLPSPRATGKTIVL